MVAAPALIYLGVPPVAAHLLVFYAACLSNVTPPVCVSAFAAAAIAQADPIKTGLAALKFGFALIFLPFAFVYRTPLLLMGSAFEIAYSTVISLIGFMAFAMAIQGSDFFHPTISLKKRILFGVAGALILFPSKMWVDGMGFTLLMAGWLPTLILRRQVPVQSKMG